MSLPTPQYLRECLHLDYETGLMMWQERPARHFKSAAVCNQWNARFAGKIAGDLDRHGYRRIRLDNKCHRAHRVVFVHAHGREPSGLVDHVNGERDDNRPLNLREANGFENGQNRVGLHVRNASGITGVHWCKRDQRWLARINIDGRQTHLGSFERKSDAVRARKAAERQHYGEFAPAPQEAEQDD